MIGYGGVVVLIFLQMSVVLEKIDYSLVTRLLASLAAPVLRRCDASHPNCHSHVNMTALHHRQPSARQANETCKYSKVLVAVVTCMVRMRFLPAHETAVVLRRCSCTALSHGNTATHSP